MSEGAFTLWARLSHCQGLQMGKDMGESQLGTSMALYLLPGKKHIPFLTKAEPELWARNKPFIR